MAHFGFGKKQRVEPELPFITDTKSTALTLLKCGGDAINIYIKYNGKGYSFVLVQICLFRSKWQLS
jgi:hypothetical protein